MSDHHISCIGNHMTQDPVHGGDVYRNEVTLDFSVNLNPLPMPDAIMKAAAQGLSEMHQYPDPLQQELKYRISAYEGVPAENIICGNGASELLMAVCHASRPRKALITAPCYAGYERALKAAGAGVTEYYLDETKGFALDEGFPDALSKDLDIVMIADPNNPNGRLIERDLKDRIIQRCEELGIILVLDECFLPLTERGLHRTGLAGKALQLRAFTKTFAVPGIRIGYMMSEDRAMLTEIASQLPEWNVSRIAERTGEAAATVLHETDYLAESVRMIGTERAWLEHELRQIPVTVYGSDTNYLLLRSRPDLYDRLLDKGILIRKCANFSGLDDSYFRIAVRKHEDNRKLIEAMKESL